MILSLDGKHSFFVIPDPQPGHADGNQAQLVDFKFISRNFFNIEEVLEDDESELQN